MTDVDPEVLNKSLDEIIAASAGKRKTKAGGGAKAGVRVKGVGKKGPGGKSTVNPPIKTVRSGVSKSRTPQSAGRSQGRPQIVTAIRTGGGSRSAPRARAIQPIGGRGLRQPYDDAGREQRKRDALEGDGNWHHDMYGGRRGGNPPPQAAPARRSGPARIRVMNLGYDVLEPELGQLFSKFNATKWSVRYDKANRSTGMAYVDFPSFRDAERARDEYHMRTIDERPIMLEIMDQDGGAAGAGSGGSGGGIFDRMGARPGGGGRRRGGDMDMD